MSAGNNLAPPPPPHKNYKAAQLFSTLIIRNVSWAENQHISMISEGSCDAEDWSNDAENVPSQK